MNNDAVLQQLMEVLEKNVNITIVLFCLVIGAVIKHFVAKLDNTYIPLILLVSGIVFSIILAIPTGELKTDTVNVIITGIASAVASIGIHQTGKTLMSLGTKK